MKSPEAYTPSIRVRLISTGLGLVASASSIYFTFTTAREYSMLRTLERNVIVVTDTEYFVTTLGTDEQIATARDDLKRSGFAAVASLGTALATRSVLGIQDEKTRKQRRAETERRLEEFDMTMEMLDSNTGAILDPRGYSSENSPELHHWGETIWREEEQTGFPLGSQHRFAKDIEFQS